MAQYNGTIVLSGMISPTDTLDTYPTHEDILGKGGYSSVVDIPARDNISDLRRKIGMMVYVESDNKVYQLQGGILDTDWTEFTSGSGLDETAVNNLIDSKLHYLEIDDGDEEIFLNEFERNKLLFNAKYFYDVAENINKIEYWSTVLIYNLTFTYVNGEITEKLLEKISDRSVKTIFTYTNDLITDRTVAFV